MEKHYHPIRDGVKHSHAEPEYKHSHMLRAICSEQRCLGYPTHDIHEMPERKPGFWSQVAVAQFEHPEWRYGQTVFNVAREMHPEQADNLRGDPFSDPFHDDKLVPAFVKAMNNMLDKENWLL
jgi:hypothetical protein